MSTKAVNSKSEAAAAITAAKIQYFLTPKCKMLRTTQRMARPQSENEWKKITAVVDQYQYDKSCAHPVYQRFGILSAAYSLTNSPHEAGQSSAIRNSH